ncbi:MAG: lycopene cyclase domain-containing protein [Saprospiraceae bacterium]|nr:lycopene cyclase domain-containing protein [Saprospiraceae bacterium]
MKKQLLRYLIPLLSLAAIIWHSATHAVKTNNLLYDVNELGRVSVFETRGLYFFLHLIPLIPILTFSLFDKKIQFPKTWRALFPALFVVAVVFWIWDAWKTAIGVWGFNDRYFTIKIGNLPIEEWGFFFTFPWAILFFYHSLHYYVPQNRFFRAIEYPLSIGLILFFFGIAVFNWGKTYTATTSIAAGAVLLWQFLFDTETDFRADFYRVYIVGLAPFLLVNGILTGIATEQPVVVYNPEEYLGIRFFTIPLDDFIYNFALLFSVTMFYEWFKAKQALANNKRSEAV